MMSMTFARTLLGATLLVGACNPNPQPAVIRDIRLDNAPVSLSGVPEIASGSPLAVTVTTEGRCNPLRVHWGDDDPWDRMFATFLISWKSFGHDFNHTYPSTGALRGYKSVTAAGDASTCIGEVKKRFLVTPQLMTFGWSLGGSACGDAPPIMQTKLGNVVYLVQIPPPVPGPGYSPLIGQIVVGRNQVYDANGAAELGDATFPFPGWLKYSVIVQVIPPGVPGPHLFQGGTNFSFRVAQPNSKIQFCYNSNPMPPDPTVGQGFEVRFRADASNAELPP